MAEPKQDQDGRRMAVADCSGDLSLSAIDSGGEINSREKWQHKQKQAIVSNYKKAPHWPMLEPLLEEIWTREWKTIAQLNIHVVRKLVEILGIETPLHVASEMGVFPDDPDERLIAITKHFGAKTYLAGSGGHGYMDMEKYERNQVKVDFQEFNHPVYRQLFGDFMPFMSVIDLIFNNGHESLQIIRENNEDPCHRGPSR